MTKEKPRYRRIATEEAWATAAQFDAFRKVADRGGDNLDVIFLKAITSGDSGRNHYAALFDIGDGRIADMDAHGVDMHLLMLTSPGVQMFSADEGCAIAGESNDILAEAIRRHPTRLAGLAAFAPQAPDRAAREMERAVNTLGLNGFVVNSHTNNHYLDEEQFWPILEAAEALDRPIYIHPRSPSDGMAAPYRDHNLETALWGYQAETGLHGMRLILSGVFDRFPGLKIVLGHAGEGLPYWLYRLDYMYQNISVRRGATLKRLPSDYIRSNFLFTTSGMNDPLVLDYMVKAVGPDNLLWAIDYPYQKSAEAVSFAEGLDLTDEVAHAFFHGNAERAFHIAPAAQGDNHG